MSFKNLILILVGASLGSIVMAFILYPQINNRYVMGVNTGEISGGNKIIEFLSKNITHDSNSSILPLKIHLDHKASRLSIVEINGVQTIFVE